MLILDELFASGEPVPRRQDRDNVILGCVLWADDAGRRVRFYISPDIIDGACAFASGPALKRLADEHLTTGQDITSSYSLMIFGDSPHAAKPLSLR
jgi:hypothetical protein